MSLLYLGGVNGRTIICTTTRLGQAGELACMEWTSPDTEAAADALFPTGSGNCPEQVAKPSEHRELAYAYPTTRQYQTYHSFPIEEQLMLLL